MITEIIIAAILFYAIFGSYISAATDEMKERARKLSLENDRTEFDVDHPEEI